MKQILCFGDSNTYGLIPGTKDRYDWDTRWSGRIGQRLWEDGCRIVEEGLCGRTTVFDDPLRDGRRGTELLSVILETHKPVDVVVLMLGTNDCKTMYDTSAEVIGRGVERLLDQIRSSTPDSKIPNLMRAPLRCQSVCRRFTGGSRMSGAFRFWRHPHMQSQVRKTEST